MWGLEDARTEHTVRLKVRIMGVRRQCLFLFKHGTVLDSLEKNRVVVPRLSRDDGGVGVGAGACL